MATDEDRAEDRELDRRIATPASGTEDQRGKDAREAADRLAEKMRKKK